VDANASINASFIINGFYIISGCYRAFKECVLHLFITKVKVFGKKVKYQCVKVKVIVSNEKSCQKEYTCKI
jgi:hypothetical protein